MHLALAPVTQRWPGLLATLASVSLLLPCHMARAQDDASTKASAEEKKPADEKKKDDKKDEAPVRPVKTLTLPECIAIGLENQPSLKAQWASLGATSAGKAGVDASKAPKCLAPTLPIRRQQAALGLTAGLAAVEAAERNVINAVSRVYLAAIYARQQNAIAEKAITDLTDDYDIALKTSPNTQDRHRFEVALNQAKLKLQESRRGVVIASAALLEAMGLGREFEVLPSDKEIPRIDLKLDKDELIHLALSRRPELRQAEAATAIICLEVDAQACSKKKSVATFAKGSDIHVVGIPPAGGGADYRPGPIGFEMPPYLFGEQCYRIERAKQLCERANAVVEKSKNLTALEVQDAYSRWQDAVAQIPITATAETEAINYHRFAKNAVSNEQLVRADVEVAETKSKHLEQRYRVAYALLYLDFITAGSIHPWPGTDQKSSASRLIRENEKKE